MVKAAIVVLADTETHGDMGRVSNALRAVQEFKKNDDYEGHPSFRSLLAAGYQVITF